MAVLKSPRIGERVKNDVTEIPIDAPFVVMMVVVMLNELSVILVLFALVNMEAERCASVRYLSWLSLGARIGGAEELAGGLTRCFDFMLRFREQRKCCDRR